MPAPLPLILLDAPRGTYWKTWHRYLQDHLLRRRMISEEDLALYKITDDIDVAFDEITSFYDVYHSSRYVRDQLALRLTRPLPAPFVTALAAEFDDIITSGTIVQRRAFSAERDEPEAQHLQRLAFRFNRTRFGRLRRLIDRINEAPEKGAEQ